MTSPILAVWAQSASNGISYRGRIAWKVPNDLQFFLASLALQPEGTKTAMVLGRATYEAVGSRAIAGTIPYIISSSRPEGSVTKSRTLKSGAISVWNEIVSNSLEGAIALAQANQEVGLIVIAGGASIYAETVKKCLANTLWVTKFNRKDGLFETDNPVINQPDDEDSGYVCVGVSPSEASMDHPGSEVTYSIYTYERRDTTTPPMMPWSIPNVSTILAKSNAENSPAVDQRVQASPSIVDRSHEEFQYLDLIVKILNDGDHQIDRTEVGTKSIFGASMRFSLRNGVFPLLTTKRVFWRGVVEELLWFIKGDTNAKNLQDKNVHIWDGNSSREFLDSRGLNHREIGDLGPIYGFQWRHFGADYQTMHTDYTAKGIDQIQAVIDTLKTNPSDRRMIVCAWNPAALPEMALPPCHCLFQFYASGKGELSCLMYQRSADVGLGVPFNISSYALLTCMIAQVVGMQPGEFVHVLGNTHIYMNHLDALKEQLQRVPKPFPLVKLNRTRENIDDFIFEDFELVGYDPYKAIHMKMAV